MRDQLKLVPLIVDDGIGKVLPAASIVAPEAMVPAAIAVFRSVRRARDNCSAPSTFRRPAPCCSRLAFGNGCAEYWRIALISGGVSPGLTCNISATVPATAGAAMEVPLIIICVSVEDRLDPERRDEAAPPKTLAR